MIGRSISHYRIVSQLGSGGMGVVYAAEDVRLGRTVALKFLPEELAKDQQAVKRLQAEARAASALNHPNICTIHDIGEDDGRPFIVMELMKGQNLRDRLASGIPKIHETVDLGIQIADALDAAHSSGILHRDIKPANLFVTDRRQVKILDFGLAKLLPAQTSGETTAPTSPDQLTAEGVTIGTVSYMSPEQVTGEQLDGRTDLFSLGIVLYECVTGHRPFVGKTSAVIFSAILNRAPVAPIVYNADLPLRLQEAILNCLEKDRELRYQDAAGLRADLKRIKRDLESGHSVAADMASGLTGATVGSRVTRTSLSAADSFEQPTVSSQQAARPRRQILGASFIVMAVVAFMAGLYFLLPTLQSPRTTAPAAASDSIVQSRLESANSSLQARNYRAALASAEDVLRAVPDHAEALRIRDSAREMVARFDEAISKANRLLAVGDVDGANEAVTAARAIDPAAPAVTDLSARLVEQFRRQTSEARRAGAESTANPAPVPGPKRQPLSEPPRPAAQLQPPSAAPRSPSSQVPPPQAASSPPPIVSTPSGDIQLPGPTTAPAEARPALPASAEARPAPPPPSPQAVETPPSRSEPAVAPRDRDTSAAPPPQVEDDDAMIRKIVAAYARAIETKDLALFRSVKPNLSAQEQRRIEEGFRAVSSQRVTVTILGINRRGQEASVRLRRHDEIDVGGRVQTTDSQQTLTLVHAGSGWVIRDIGR